MGKPGLASNTPVLSFYAGYNSSSNILLQIIRWSLPLNPLLLAKLLLTICINRDIFYFGQLTVRVNSFML